MGSGVVMTVVVREELKLKVVGKEDDCEGQKGRGYVATGVFLDVR